MQMGKKNNVEVRRHSCPMNYEGSSKGMESTAALLLTIKLYDEKGVAVEEIVADDDSSMKAIVRHSFDEKKERKDLFPDWTHPTTTDGKLKPSTGLLPLHIPEPT